MLKKDLQKDIDKIFKETTTHKDFIYQGINYVAACYFFLSAAAHAGSINGSADREENVAVSLSMLVCGIIGYSFYRNPNVYFLEKQNEAVSKVLERYDRNLLAPQYHQNAKTFRYTSWMEVSAIGLCAACYWTGLAGPSMILGGLTAFVGSTLYKDHLARGNRQILESALPQGVRLPNPRERD